MRDHKFLKISIIIMMLSMASETSSARSQKNEEQNVLVYVSTAVMKVTPQYEVNHVIMAEPTLA